MKSYFISDFKKNDLFRRKIRQVIDGQLAVIEEIFTGLNKDATREFSCFLLWDSARQAFDGQEKTIFLEEIIAFSNMTRERFLSEYSAFSETLSALERMVRFP